MIGVSIKKKLGQPKERAKCSKQGVLQIVLTDNNFPLLKTHSLGSHYSELRSIHELCCHFELLYFNPTFFCIL